MLSALDTNGSRQSHIGLYGHMMSLIRTASAD